MQHGGPGEEHQSPPLRPSPQPQRRSPPTPISRGDPAVIAKPAAWGGSRDRAVCAALGCIWQDHQHMARCGGEGTASPVLPPRPRSSPRALTHAWAPSGQRRRRGGGWRRAERLARGWGGAMGTTAAAAAGVTSERAPPEQPGACGAALEGNALTPMCCTLGFASLLFLCDFFRARFLFPAVFAVIPPSLRPRFSPPSLSAPSFAPSFLSMHSFLPQHQAPSPHSPPPNPHPHHEPTPLQHQRQTGSTGHNLP